MCLWPQRNGLAARRARLIAEADGKAEIDFPKELQEDGSRQEADRRRDGLQDSAREAPRRPARGAR